MGIGNARVSDSNVRLPRFVGEMRVAAGRRLLEKIRSPLADWVERHVGRLGDPDLERLSLAAGNLAAELEALRSS